MTEATSHSLAVVICASRQDPSTVGTKRRSAHPILMGKGGDQLAQGHIPELGGLVRARRQDPGTVGTKRRPLNPILMGKGCDQLARATPQSLAVLSQLAVRIRAPSGLNSAQRTVS